MLFLIPTRPLERERAHAAAAAEGAFADPATNYVGR